MPDGLRILDCGLRIDFGIAQSAERIAKRRGAEGLLSLVRGPWPAANKAKSKNPESRIQRESNHN